MRDRVKRHAAKTAAPATRTVPEMDVIVRDDGPAPQTDVVPGEAALGTSRGPARKRRAKFVF